MHARDAGRERDSSTISRLINEGQIFRFIAKPAGPGFVSRMIQSALKKHRDLMAQPTRIARHAVEISRRPALEYASEGPSGWASTEVAPLAASPYRQMEKRATTGSAPVSGVAWLRRLFGTS